MRVAVCHVLLATVARYLGALPWWAGHMSPPSGIYILEFTSMVIRAVIIWTVVKASREGLPVCGGG